MQILPPMLLTLFHTAFKTQVCIDSQQYIHIMMDLQSRSQIVQVGLCFSKTLSPKIQHKLKKLLQYIKIKIKLRFTLNGKVNYTHVCSLSSLFHHHHT